MLRLQPLGHLSASEYIVIYIIFWKNQAGFKKNMESFIFLCLVNANNIFLGVAFTFTRHKKMKDSIFFLKPA